MKLLGFLVAFVFLGQVANADYFKGQFGLVGLSGEAKGGGSVDHKSQVLSPVLVTYGKSIMPNVSVEFEIGYWHNDLDLDAQSKSLGIKADSSAIGVGINWVYHVAVPAPVSPYLGIGAFFGMYEMGASAPFAPSESEDGFGVAIQPFAGAQYKINENFGLGAELRYIRTVLDPEINDVDVTFSNMTFGLVASYHM